MFEHDKRKIIEFIGLEWEDFDQAFDANFMVKVIAKMKELGAVVEAIPTKPPFCNFTVTDNSASEWTKFSEHVRKYCSCGKSMGWWVDMLTNPDKFFRELLYFLKHNES